MPIQTSFADLEYTCKICQNRSELFDEKKPLAREHNTRLQDRQCNY